jgi:hypothetical protein
LPKQVALSSQMVQDDEGSFPIMEVEGNQVESNMDLIGSVYIFISVYMYILSIYVHIYIYTSVYMYIYIYG